MLREKKSVVDLLTGGKDLPLKIDFEPGAKKTIIGAIALLGLSAILTALIFRSINPKRSRK